MNPDQLEKLVKISANNGKGGYRSSLLVEAAEVLEYIRQKRPELYEHVLAEANRKSAEVTESALAKINPEIDFSDISKNLENTITIQDYGQNVAYRGSLFDLSWDFESNNVSGYVKLTKDALVPLKKKKWKLFPPSITEVEVLEWKKVWMVNSGDWSNRAIRYIIEKGKISSNYRNILISIAQDKKYLPSPSLLSAVFDPLDQKVLELYNSYKSIT